MIAATGRNSPTDESSADLKCNALVLGTGPSGAAAANVLARAGCDVVIVDGDHNPSFHIGETLPGRARMHFAKAGFSGLLGRIPHIVSAGNRSAWGSDDLHSRSAIADPYGGGVHVDRDALNRELIAVAAGAGANIIERGRFAEASRARLGWSVRIQSQGQSTNVSCQWVIDCTGRRSAFARAQGVARMVCDKQVAIVVLLNGPDISDPDLTTTIEAGPNGWWYTAQLPRRRRMLMYFTDGDCRPPTRPTNVAQFIGVVQQTRHVKEYLRAGYVIEAGPKTVLADTSHLATLGGVRWVAAGDAAVALDPLASAGIMDAIRSGSGAALAVLSPARGLKGYADAIFEQHRTNLRTRQDYYRAETRWPASTFWSRRQSDRFHRGVATVRSSSLARK